MYVEAVPNRGSRPAILLRESIRRGTRILKHTLANISDWPAQKIETLRRLLRDETLVSPTDVFTTVRSRPHGHVEAVLGLIRKLGVDRLISSTPSRERDLIVALVAARILYPSSKLATSHILSSCTLAEELGLGDETDVDELYEALDWLLQRQGRIEKKLARRHLATSSRALYDVSSSFYYGRHCTLAALGHDRDGKRHTPIIVYGLLTDGQGRPVAVSVYPGNTGDPATVPDQVSKLKGDFGLSDVVLVGDRGMLTRAQLKVLRAYPGLGWISALRSTDIRKLLDDGPLQPSLFDERNLAEIASPNFPGERLVACFNPLLAEDRRRTRRELLEETDKQLGKIVREAARRTRTPLTDAELGLKAGRVVNRFKVAKHVRLTIHDGQLSFEHDEESIRREAELDGIYVIRTNQSPELLSADDAVRTYKSLGQVEQAFRCLKQTDLHIRPIRHRTEDHVRAHIFLCMLAYYVDWHLRRALAPLLFEDETLDHDRWQRHPVARATSSLATKYKKSQRQSADGLPVTNLQTLLLDLATRTRNTYRMTADDNACATTFTQITEPTPLQARAFELLRLYPVAVNS
jgi:transposase